MQWVHAWTKDLNKDSICGDDVSFEPEFEQLREEVEKGRSLHSDGSPDWQQVLNLASQLLEERTKDLWVFCYGIRAAYETGGLKSCHQALSILNGYLEKNWEELHPRGHRPVRRAAPFQWLVSRMESLYPEKTYPDDGPDDRKSYRAEVKRLQKILGEKLPDHAPSFTAMTARVPAEKPKKKAQASANEKTEPYVIPKEFLVSSENAQHLSASDASRLIQACLDSSRQLADHYISLSSTDPRIFLLHRAALWSTIQQLPQADAKGVTPLRSIPPDRALTYKTAVETGQYAAILPQLERSAGKTPFWFDGHFLVVRCLEGLGAKEAAQMICTLLKLFIDRFPPIISYKFHDGTPFASKETLQWIEELKTKNDAGLALALRTGFSQDLSQDNAGEEARLAKAMELSEKNNFEAGLLSLGEGRISRNRASVRDALLRAKYCLVHKREQSAFYLLKALYEKLEAWELLDWEPQLGAEVLALLLSTRNAHTLPQYENMLQSLHWLKLDMAINFITE